MKINKNDPQLTAYVLNELSPSEKKAIETLIQNDPELKLEVTRLRSNITQLRSLKANEAFRLDPHQRENLFKAAGIYQTSIWSKVLKYSGGLVAASLAVIIYTQNSTNLKKSASSKMSGADTMAAAPALSELSEPSTKVVARAESRPVAIKKIEKAEPENEDAALVHSRGAPAPGEMAQAVVPAAESDAAAPVVNAPAAPAPAKADFSEAKLAQNAELPKDISKGTFSAGDVGAPDMSQNKMRLLDPSQAQKKEAAVTDEVTSSTFGSLNTNEGRASGGASLGASSGSGSVAAAMKVKPGVSKQLYDLESKSSQAEIYLQIADPIFNCFDSSLSQYVQYDLAFNLNWSAKLGNVTSFSSEMIDYGTESLKRPRQNFSTEVSCAEQAIRQAFKSKLPPSQNETSFKYRLILKSK